MMKLMRSLLVVILLATVCPLAAQTDAEKEKARQEELEKKGLALLTQIGEETAALKLPENRIHVYVAAGEILWSRDEKRARSLLQSAAAEINQIYSQFDETESAQQQVFYSANNQRQQMLYKVGNLDPEFALELLRQTRLPAVRAYLSASPTERNNSMTGSRWQVQSDTALEQNLAIQAAQKNPARALEFARESLKRDLSHSIFGLIDQIRKTDEKAAAGIAEEVAAKLFNDSWAGENDLRSLAIFFVNSYAPPQNQAEAANFKLLVNEKFLRDLTEKFAAAYLSDNNSQNPPSSYEFTYILPLVERFAPNRTALIRRRANELADANPQQRLYDKINKLQEEGTPEQILAEIENAPSDMKNQLYQSAAYKVNAAGDGDRARRILESIPSKSEREMALKNLESTRYHIALGADKLEDAYKIAANLTDESARFEHFSNLAAAYHAKKQPEMAAKVLQELERITVFPPSDEVETQRVLRLAQVTAAISPARAVALLEPLVAQANELLAASATLGKFYKRNNYSFRDGEWILPNANAHTWGYGGDGQALKLLVAHDFDKLLSIADRFERGDVRLALRLMLAQAALPNKPPQDNNPRPAITVVESPRRISSIEINSLLRQ